MKHLKIYVTSSFWGSKRAILMSKLNCQLCSTTALDGLKGEILDVHLPYASFVGIALAQLTARLMATHIPASNLSWVEIIRRAENLQAFALQLALTSAVIHACTL